MVYYRLCRFFLFRDKRGNNERELFAKAERNKTIDITIEEGQDYLNRCVLVCRSTDILVVLDKTIIGDMFSVASLLLKNFVDLLIVDPSYNLDKDFRGSKHKKTSDNIYEQYTDSWINTIQPLLKNNATIYVCCDWQSSALIGRVLSYNVAERKGRGALNNWKNGMEDIWFATNSKVYAFNIDNVKTRRKVIAPYKVEGKPKDWEETKDGNFRNTYPSNFWDDISIPYWWMPENTERPTQKPKKLLAKLILASSNKGDVVLDPFLGAGTTFVTAKKITTALCRD